jgi:pimeloyl-ACP methyl ester carboxylesterase
MSGIYRSAAGERAVRESYLDLLSKWPVPAQQIRVPTCQGETFIVASGPKNAPPLLLLHGSMMNAATWMGDISIWATQFRVYAIDTIGDSGLSAPTRPPLASDSYARWLDDVLRALGVERTSIVGVSLGGWLALDYATRHPDRVEKLALLCPAGIARTRNVLWWALPLMLLGPWGTRKVRERILGRMPAETSPEVRRFVAFMTLIFENLKPRTEAPPTFDDAALARLTMPVLTIVGEKDVMLYSQAIVDRLARLLPHAQVHYLAGVGHYLGDQRVPVLKFLRTSVGSSLRASSW